jgi:hypothetical protein
MRSLVCSVVILTLLLPATGRRGAMAQTRTSLGLVSKVVLDVSRKEAENEWQQAKRGETLASGDRVKTGDRSLAVIKFKDNSLVRVRERSELVVTGEMKGSAFSKAVTVEKGAVGFNIMKQQVDEEFRFSSPTSVASIRGTGGQFVASDPSDTLVVTEGVVRLTNTVSKDSVDVQAGMTAISSVNGVIVTRPSTENERQAALDAARIGERDNQLEFDLRDGRGGRRKLKIDYRQ